MGINQFMKYAGYVSSQFVLTYFTLAWNLDTMGRSAFSEVAKYINFEIDAGTFYWQLEGVLWLE